MSDSFSLNSSRQKFDKNAFESDFLPKLTDAFCDSICVDCELHKVEEHEGGRNLIYICEKEHEPRYVLRVSMTGDRAEKDYIAETEFVRYLAENGASVADVIPSRSGRLVEEFSWDNMPVYVSLFAFAKGMLISDNGYRYREGAPLSEYFFNTGKTLGKIHALAKKYVPQNDRADYFEKYNMNTVNALLSDEFAELKEAIARRLDIFKALPKTKDNYGMVHFDFSDGNYHIDMSSGDITVFDFDNCMNCWYMFDLANLWTHGVGWCQFEEDSEVRKAYMKDYFDTVVRGYRSETEVSDEMLEQLPLFIDMVLIENIVDECECCARAGEQLDYEDIEDAAECLINNIPFAGFLE